jgi:hypothetical protein
MEWHCLHAQDVRERAEPQPLGRVRLHSPPYSLAPWPAVHRRRGVGFEPYDPEYPLGRVRLHSPPRPAPWAPWPCSCASAARCWARAIWPRVPPGSAARLPVGSSTSPRRRIACWPSAAWVYARVDGRAHASGQPDGSIGAALVLHCSHSYWLSPESSSGLTYSLSACSSDATGTVLQTDKQVRRQLVWRSRRLPTAAHAARCGARCAIAPVRARRLRAVCYLPSR